MKRGAMIRMPARLCPECGYLTDAVSPIGEGKPEAGDLSLCLNCGAPALFTRELKLRELTLEEFKALPANYKRAIRYARAAAHRVVDVDLARRGGRV